MATLAVTNSFSAGTTIVAADMNQNFDDVEAFINTTPGVVQEDIIDAVGDIIHGDAADSVAKLAVGTNDHCLVADSSVSSVGLKWAVPTDTTKMPLAGGTFTGAITIDGASPIVLEGASADGYETTIAVTDPTADNTITLPDEAGTVALTSGPGSAVTVTNEDNSHTFALTDSGKVFVMSGASGATTLTVQTDAQMDHDIGTNIIFTRQHASNAVTFAAGSASLLSKDSNLSIDGQYATAALLKIAANTWLLFGALA